MTSRKNNGALVKSLMYNISKSDWNFNCRLCCFSSILDQLFVGHFFRLTRWFTVCLVLTLILELLYITSCKLMLTISITKKFF